MTQFLAKTALILGLLKYSLALLFDNLHRRLSSSLRLLLSKPPPADPSSPSAPDPRKTVLVIGASFAGYHAARLLATTLPPATHRVCVVEPRSHFHFTWILPRLAVVPGHEHKAFIPYGPYLAGAPAGAVAWVRDAVARVERGGRAVLRSGRAVEFEFCVVATGAPAGGPPGAVGAERKDEGMAVLRGVREGIEAAGCVVVVGGGAVGVEVAADAKARWPGKRVVLVHSREVLLARFGPELRACVMRAMEELGVEVVLGEKVREERKEDGVVTLTSGRELPCDYLIDCTGQKPASGVLAELSPSSIAPSGHIRVRPTMQILDQSLPNIYVVGDVAETEAPRTNARSAMKQATVAADNILLAVRGKEPKHQYKYEWQDGSILLTLGLNKQAVNISDGRTELVFQSKGKGIDLNAAAAWKHLGVKPFVDEDRIGNGEGDQKL